MRFTVLGPVYMEWGTPVWWGKFLLFCVPQSVKTKETNPTRPGSPTPCKRALRVSFHCRVIFACVGAQNLRSQIKERQCMKILRGKS